MKKSELKKIIKECIREVINSNSKPRKNLYENELSSEEMRDEISRLHRRVKYYDYADRLTPEERKDRDEAETELRKLKHEYNVLQYKLEDPRDPEVILPELLKQIQDHLTYLYDPERTPKEEYEGKIKLRKMDDKYMALGGSNKEVTDMIDSARKRGRELAIKRAKNR
jgi:hypothetical protein